MFQTSPYDRIPPTVDDSKVVNVIVEIPKGHRNRFEVDKDSGLIGFCVESAKLRVGNLRVEHFYPPAQSDEHLANG